MFLCFSVLFQFCGEIVPVKSINHRLSAIERSSKDHQNSSTEAVVAAEFCLIHARALI
jgi:hypothetical protein